MFILQRLLSALATLSVLSALTWNLKVAIAYLAGLTFFGVIYVIHRTEELIDNLTVSEVGDHPTSTPTAPYKEK